MDRPDRKAMTPDPSVRNDSPEAGPSAGWEVTWRRTGGAGQGGQGVGFIAVDDNTGRQAFIKRLHRPRDIESRKRFHREVAAYETLSHRGLPKLFGANREQWRERDVELYLVLEYIRGDTLGQPVGGHARPHVN